MGLGKDVALQKAKIAVIHGAGQRGLNSEARNPYYWAPFILIGGHVGGAGKFVYPVAVLDPQPLEELLFAFEQRGQCRDCQRFAEAVRAGEKIVRLRHTNHLVEITGFVDIDEIARDHLLEITHTDRKRFFHFAFKLPLKEKLSCINLTGKLAECNENARNSVMLGDVAELARVPTPEVLPLRLQFADS